MSPTLRSSVFGNAATLIAFRLGGDDARAIHTLLDDWPPETLTDLDNHTAIIRPLLYGQTISPFILKTHEVPPGITFGKNNERHILNFSRMKYGKPRYQVEGEITRWMEGSGTRASRNTLKRVAKTITRTPAQRKNRG